VRGDMWAASWADADLVYLFQRPESMARAWAKAEREMAPGSWLVSLEFEIAARTPVARLEGAGGRPVWVYRIGMGSSAQFAAAGPANSSDPDKAKNSSRQRRRR
jgi:hypothetical protein